MKREFLQNLKVGDSPLPKEVIDAILDENSRDIGEAKKPFADYEAIKDQLKTAREGLKAFEGQDVSSLQSKIAELQGQLTAKDTQWQERLDSMAFESLFKEAVSAARGKNAGAVTGALGAEEMSRLRASKNQAEDIKSALETLKKDSGYLFDTEVPPPYAPGTGTGGGDGGKAGFNFGFVGIRPHDTAK